LENSALYRVLFLVVRALAGSRTSSPGATEDSVVTADAKQGFTLTGDVFLPPDSVPAADMFTATDAFSASGPRAELFGTFRINADGADSMTLNFHQAGQLVRTFHLDSDTHDGGARSQMGLTNLSARKGGSANAAD
jgi:hypothetical protein